MEIPKSVTMCEDGKIRWAYELPMMKTMTILVTVWKVLAIALCLPYLITLVGALKDFWKITFVFFMIYAGIVVVSLIAYTILAASYGWHYCVVFEMDDEGIVHQQQQKQFKKAEAIAAIEMIAGAASGNPARTGQGLLIATKSSIFSRFSMVKSVKINERQGLIKLDYLLSHNQIYVEPDAFSFVADYIEKRCTNAKIKRV